MHPYKNQLVQELKPNDLNLHRVFVETMLEHFVNFNNIFFSKKAHFYLNGHVNKQNCRYWAQENPKSKRQKLLHSPKVTVWAPLQFRGLSASISLKTSEARL